MGSLVEDEWESGLRLGPASASSPERGCCLPTDRSALLCLHPIPLPVPFSVSFQLSLLFPLQGASPPSPRCSLSSSLYAPRFLCPDSDGPGSSFSARPHRGHTKLDRPLARRPPVPLRSRKGSLRRRRLGTPVGQRQRSGRGLGPQRCVTAALFAFPSSSFLPHMSPSPSRRSPCAVCAPCWYPHRVGRPIVLCFAPGAHRCVSCWCPDMRSISQLSCTPVHPHRFKPGIFPSSPLPPPRPSHILLLRLARFLPSLHSP